jgi:hypothetical protein
MDVDSAMLYSFRQIHLNIFLRACIRETYFMAFFVRQYTQTSLYTPAYKYHSKERTSPSYECKTSVRMEASFGFNI